MTNNPNITNLQTADVLSLRHADDVAAKAKEALAFDKLYAEYLNAVAKWAHGVPDDESDELGAKQHDLIWQIIRTPAPHKRHVDDKLEVLREIMQTEWTDCRREALIESIRNDVAGV
jgi:hypothetical protein